MPLARCTLIRHRLHSLLLRDFLVTHVHVRNFLFQSTVKTPKGSGRKSKKSRAIIQNELKGEFFPAPSMLPLHLQPRKSSRYTLTIDRPLNTGSFALLTEVVFPGSRLLKIIEPLRSLGLI
jgi:hypothetical protein